MIIRNITRWWKGVSMAINDITGRAIKTGIQNKDYDKGWDRIFAKKTAYEWIKETPEVISIVSPDGWDEEVTLDTPIKWLDFQQRLNISTIITNV
jgi:hypothetical protein